MKISIIITTRDRLSLLKRAIASSLAQKIAHEIIVIDDGSSDGTGEYLETLTGKVRVYRNSRNLGHAGSVNRGVALATGDWIKLLDDDDYLAPDCLAIMAREIARYPRAVIASCQAAQVNPSGGEIKRTRRVGRGKIAYISRSDIHYRMLLEYLPFGTPAQVMFRKDAFTRSGGWNSAFDLDFDDIESWLKIARFGDAIFINQCLAYRTIWHGGHNQKFSIQERLNAHIAVKEKMYACVDREYREHLPPLADIRNYLRLHWALIALKRGRIRLCREIVASALFSVNAWRLLFQVLFVRLQAGT
ncbi:glycosyltransferase family 2 protein [Pannus brasiliensis CCIBt3594]|uniref:Glycosyltransferase family 2 protein n=1 Tax=Pannus brasiliensis CCIBt3594 TaxID=1427578 RepID=A0AAW9QPX1_9CHRO